MFYDVTTQAELSRETRFDPIRDMCILQRKNNIHRQGAVTFSCLGKLQTVDAVLLQRWKGYLRELIQHIPLAEAVQPMVVGLAESGIIPSALLHQILLEKQVPANWICSTRRPAPGLCFSETHSHGPDHVLPLPGRPPESLWFMEDEITTGRTLLHLSLHLCRYLDIRQVRFFAFADSRSSRQKTAFREALAAHDIDFTTHVLFAPDITEKTATAAPDPLRMDREVDAIPVLSGQYVADDQWLLPRSRPALGPRKSITGPLPRNLKGSLLAVGEAVDLGIRIVQANPGLGLRQITLSPWKIDDHHIRNRLAVEEKYYLYNAGTIRPPVYLLFDPIDRAVGETAQHLLKKEGLPVEMLRLPEPEV